jgi:hypothetical protein
MNWGSTAEERALPFACDAMLAAPDDTLFRAVTVEAPASTLFRWLCQLRVAPYSYDLLDNFGRRSPRHLVAGLDDLEVGQRVMIFELAAFAPDRHLTLRLHGHRIFGDIALTYLVVPIGPDHCRLVVKLLVRYPKGVLGGLARRVLPAGDAVMMRKQLLTFKHLAEAERVSAPPPDSPVAPGQTASR